MATKSWAEVLKTTYTNVGLKSPMGIIDLMAFELRGFDDYPKVSKFYHNTFGEITRLAERLMGEGIRIKPDAPKDESYIILPSGTPVNNGLAMGMRHVIPDVDEIFAVSKNKFAHQVDPFLFFNFDRAFVIKAVPELPKPMLEYAQRKNINVH